MANDDLKKERLAFVSANILVLGLISIKLWPMVSLMQTGMHIHLFTDSDPGGDVIRSEYWVFTFLTKLLIAFAAIEIFAISYLFLQGLKLLIASDLPQSGTNGGTANDSKSSLEDSLDKLSQKIYGAVFLAGPYLSIWALLMFLGLVLVPLEIALAPKLGLSLTALGWILRPVALLLLTMIVVVASYKVSKAIDWETWKQKFMPLGWTTVVIAVAVLLIADPIVTHSSYTLELNLKDTIIDRSQSKRVELYMMLGGATSSPKEATLQLLNSEGNIVIDSLALNDLGKGKYVSFIPNSNLSVGRYQVVLSYPHSSLDSAPPFFKRQNQKVAWFLVVE